MHLCSFFVVIGPPRWYDRKNIDVLFRASRRDHAAAETGPAGFTVRETECISTVGLRGSARIRHF